MGVNAQREKAAYYSAYQRQQIAADRARLNRSQLRRMSPKAGLPFEPGTNGGEYQQDRRTGRWIPNMSHSYWAPRGNSPPPSRPRIHADDFRNRYDPSQYSEHGVPFKDVNTPGAPR